ncbi:helix-turn-helix domain-containing protein [Pelagicoccus enzymogenes]|nr:helix-turn-helix domain-containing protein [Pelagicoccus enzymogenes]MDQ8199718.1 helix-turn-helix domain-containing protein [Pelagicoccus enzymogenes]
MRRADHHNEIELNLLRRGSVTYLLAGSKVEISAGQLAAFWASIPHQVIDYEDNTDYYVTTIPFAWFLQFKLPEAFVRTLLHGSLLKENLGGKAELDYSRFAEWETDLLKNQNEVQDIVLLELHARLHRMAIRVADDCSLEQKKQDNMVKLQDGSLNKVEQIACFIAQHYLEPLTAEQIGEATGIHPNYAMNLFKKAFGTTLINYLTHHRISHAQRLLVTTDLKILDIAMESGFHTLSRFNSAFRQTCGCSPREYRAHQK